MKLKPMTIILLVCLYIMPSFKLFALDFSHNVNYARAKITSIEKKVRTDIETDQPYYDTIFTVKVLSGQFKNETRSVTFTGEDTMPSYVKYRVGEQIFIGFNSIGMEGGTEEYISLYDIDNSAGIFIMAILFIVIIVIIGRIRGFFSLIALLITIAMLFFGFIPLTLKGFPPLLSAIIIAIVSILLTIPIITGRSKKTIAAIAGASSGILIGSTIAIICGTLMHLAGIVTDQMLKVFYLSEIEINLKDIALSGMIIAALGAIMDVAISIASSAAELYEANPKLDSKQAFNSLLTIGKDILGSMVNTLILAYVGSSLSLILLIYLKFDSQMPVMMIFSHNPVLIEIVKSFVGSVGMFLSIPITALISVKLFSPKGKLV